MSDSIIYLDVEDVLLVHSRMIEEFGGTDGVRDLGLITAAVMRPQTGYYSDVIEECAALWESLAMNHGFVDGNKRVGFACADVFLDINGYELVETQRNIISFILRFLEAREFNKDNLKTWLRERVVKKID